MNQAAKPDWPKIVSESNGQMLFLPEVLLEDAKTWLKDREEYNKLVEQMAEKELLLNVKFQNLILEVRKYLKKIGRIDAFTKDAGFDTDALLEKKFIITLIEPRQRLPQY